MDRSSSRPRLAALALAPALALLLAVAAPASAGTGDPLRSQQWVFSAGDPAGVHEAWKRSSGAGVVVAVIDSGIQLDHPDLAGNIWTNPGEVANGIDDDANGIVDDLHGANMLAGDGAVDDDRGHGTNVAGIVASRTGNGVGGAGIAGQARLMAVKVSDAAHGPSLMALARGIRYAVTEGARIINVSLTGLGSSELTDAVAFAEEQGATIVTAAGNYGADIDAQPSYPASLPSPAVIAVTATGETGRIIEGVSYGARTVDLAAPGDMMLTTARGSDYALSSGTSIAAPVVAGSLALLAGARPDLPQAALREALLASATRTANLTGKVATGRVNVGAAMRRVAPGASTALAGATGLRLRGARRARAGSRASVRWSATNAGSIKRWRVSLDGRPVRTLSSGQALRAHTRIARAGRHRWTVTGYDAANRRVVSSARSFLAVGRR